MTLSDRDILGYLGRDLIIEPHPSVIQPASVDLHLGSTLQVLAGTLIDPYPPPGKAAPTVRAEELPRILMDGGYLLDAGRFVLGATLEYVAMPHDLVGIVTGKSSLARIGLQIESAGYVDPGWKGQLTLEIVNLGPAMIVLRPGMPICQLRFSPMSSPVLHPYGDRSLGSHYQDSVGPVTARFEHRTDSPGSISENVPLVGDGGRPGIVPGSC